MESRALHALAMEQADAGDGKAALALLHRAIDVDRAIGYAVALGHDLVDLAHIHLSGAGRAQARAALQEALMWFDYTGDHEALESTRALLAALEIENAVATLPAARRRWVKAHLPLSEGKVYCEFESPLAGSLRS